MQMLIELFDDGRNRYTLQMCSCAVVMFSLEIDSDFG